MKALEKDRNRRYESASALAADVQRYLQRRAGRRPVRRRRLYRFKKLARRNRAALATVAFVFLALIAGTAVSVWQAVRAVKAERQTAIALAEARLKNQLARRAVDEMYTQVAEKWLAEQGSLTLLQRDFLEKALSFYQEFSQSSEQTRSCATRRCWRSVESDRFRSSWDSPRRPTATFLQLQSQCTELVRQQPDRPEFRLELGFTQVKLAQAYRQTGRYGRG